MHAFQTYFILKPDSCFVFEKILQLITKYKYKILQIQYVANYFNLCKKLRQIEIENSNIYELSIIAAIIEKKLYENYAILVKVEKEDISLQQFLYKNFVFKKIVRKKFGSFSSNRASIVINVDKICPQLKSNASIGNIVVCNKDYKQQLNGLRLEFGEWKAVTLNLIHTFGPSQNEYTKSMEIIKKCKFKRLNITHLNTIIKYKTYKIF